MDAIQSIYMLNGKVTRTYVLSVGDLNRHIISPGHYNEKLFQALDSAINVASRFGVKLIIPLVDQWDWWGGISTWAAFRGRRELDFFEDKYVKKDFWEMVTWVLNRRNTITGIRYGDDPAILGWETGNELGGWDYTPPASWTIELASLIKSLAPNQLVLDGTLGGTCNPPKFAVECLEHPLIDMFSNHYYDPTFGYSSRMVKDANYVKKFKKAFFVGEYGFASSDVYDKMLSTAVNNDKISGTLCWSLRYHARDGGFYVHDEDRGFKAFHFPGFSPADGFPDNEENVVKVVMKHAMMTGNPSKLPLEAPSLLEVNGNMLRWRGSTGAFRYRIFRNEIDRNGKQVGDFALIGEVEDNVQPGQFTFKDPAQFRGRKYIYCVQAVGWTKLERGKGEMILSKYSNILECQVL
ncbi:hypothetical protein HK098_004889 [Nowakowskiella sp. JEL0407]|nr:hypothetical protein HK098_004889 [Nowakowskiella sp. JEL0407]